MFEALFNGGRMMTTLSTTKLIMEVSSVLICSTVNIYLVLYTTYIITTTIILGNPLGNHSYP